MLNMRTRSARASPASASRWCSASARSALVLNTSAMHALAPVAAIASRRAGTTPDAESRAGVPRPRTAPRPAAWPRRRRGPPGSRPGRCDRRGRYARSARQGPGCRRGARSRCPPWGRSGRRRRRSARRARARALPQAGWRAPAGGGGRRAGRAALAAGERGTHRQAPKPAPAASQGPAGPTGPLPAVVQAGPPRSRAHRSHKRSVVASDPQYVETDEIRTSRQ